MRLERDYESQTRKNLVVTIVTYFKICEMPGTAEENHETSDRAGPMEHY
jgi:hypothetical protein